MKRLPIINGVKYYPLGNNENNEHKLYTELYRLQNRGFDEETDEIGKAIENIKIINGTIYASFPHYKTLKNALINYDLRH